MVTFDERELYIKQRRRQVEYIILACIQGAIGVVFHEYLRSDTGFVIAFGAFLLGWTLARLREQRRTLEVENKSRILIDALESLVLMFILALSVIISLKIGVSLLILQAHLCLFFTSYFVGSWQSEILWRKCFLPKINSKLQHNYLMNLNRSIILPYNSTFLRSLFHK